MPDYVVMITTLGGMVVFGTNGFVLGPVIAALFFAVWDLYLTTRQVATPPIGPMGAMNAAAQATRASMER
jgi:predicted PurR-regulated permease PerM